MNDRLEVSNMFDIESFVDDKSIVSMTTVHGRFLLQGTSILVPDDKNRAGAVVSANETWHDLYIYAFGIFEFNEIKEPN